MKRIFIQKEYHWLIVYQRVGICWFWCQRTNSWSQLNHTVLLFTFIITFCQNVCRFFTTMHLKCVCKKQQDAEKSNLKTYLHVYKLILSLSLFEGHGSHCHHSMEWRFLVVDFGTQTQTKNNNNNEKKATQARQWWRWMAFDTVSRKQTDSFFRIFVVNDNHSFTFHFWMKCEENRNIRFSGNLSSHVVSSL